MDSKIMQHLFRVDNPNNHALIDTQFPKTVNALPDFDKHLSGDNCLCITPLGKDNTCYFGALDIDAKEDTPPIDHQKVQKFILNISQSLLLPDVVILLCTKDLKLE